MPKHCVAAGYDTVGGMGYSLHSFQKDETMRRKWTSAVKRQRAKWDGPSSSSFLCSRHFNKGCFVTEGVKYHNEMGIPALKRLKPDAVPTIFARSTDHKDTGGSSTACRRPLSD